MAVTASISSQGNTERFVLDFVTRQGRPVEIELGVVVGAVSEAQSEPADSTIADVDEATLCVWDVETGQLITRLPLAAIASTHKLTLDVDPDQRPIVRSVAFHPTGRHAIVTLFAPTESKYYIGDWDWNNADKPYREIRRELRDVSMATYAPDGAAILTIGGREAPVESRIANRDDELWTTECCQIREFFARQPIHCLCGCRWIGQNSCRRIAQDRRNRQDLATRSGCSTVVCQPPN